MIIVECTHLQNIDIIHAIDKIYHEHHNYIFISIT